MAKVSIEEDTLIEIADAIRNKTETTDLIDAVDMATMIESIVGGGLPFNIDFGEFEVWEDTRIHTDDAVDNKIVIDHYLNEVPQIFVFWDSYQDSRNGINNLVLCDYISGFRVFDVLNYVSQFVGRVTSSTGAMKTSGDIAVDDSTITISSTTTDFVYIRSGHIYKWIVIGGF